MDKKFEVYRQKTRKLAFFLTGLNALLALAIILFRLLLPASVTETDSFQYQLGFLCGVLAALIVVNIQVFRNLKDEKKLRERFIEAYDERLRHIRRLAGMPFVLYTSTAMLIIGSFIGYISRAAFIALVAAGLGQLFISFAVKTVAKKKI